MSDQAKERPLSLQWLSEDRIQETIRVWSKAYGRPICEDDAIEILTNVRRLTERLVPPAGPNRVANPRRVVNQRFREFRAENSGSEANLDDWFRSPVGVSRNGEFSASERIGVNRCRKGGKRKTPSRRSLGVGR